MLKIYINKFFAKNLIFWLLYIWIIFFSILLIKKNAIFRLYIKLLNY